jgi:hypothetical protein
MAIETKTTELTLRFAEPEMVPLTTVITVLPALSAVARPCEPAESLIEATAGADELQYPD